MTKDQVTAAALRLGWTRQVIDEFLQKFDLEFVASVVLATDTPGAETRTRRGSRSQVVGQQFLQKAYQRFVGYTGCRWLTAIEIKETESGEVEELVDLDVLLLLDGPNSAAYLLGPGISAFAEIRDPQYRGRAKWEPLTFEGDPLGRKRWTPLKGVAEKLDMPVKVLKHFARTAINDLLKTDRPGWSALPLPTNVDEVPELDMLDDRTAARIHNFYCQDEDWVRVVSTFA